MKTIHVDAYLADLKKEIERAEREVKPSLLSSLYKEKVGVYIGLSEVYRKALRKGDADLADLPYLVSVYEDNCRASCVVGAQHYWYGMAIGCLRAYRLYQLHRARCIHIAP